MALDLPTFFATWTDKLHVMISNAEAKLQQQQQQDQQQQHSECNA
jgi:hypothetical protein